MTAWRAAQSLLVLQRQLQAAAPLARPRPLGQVLADEWGLVGDNLHTFTSDHTPKDFPGWGSQIVTAADFPNRPDLGLDAHKVLDDIRRSHDARVKYGISNDQIFSSYATAGRAAWTWGPYNPNDPNRDRHLTHGHLSVVGDARADGTQPWQTIGGSTAPDSGDDEDMGASFGPVQLGPDTTSLVIPPVQAGVADPRETWLNVGADTYGPDYKLRIWGSNGDARFFAIDQGSSHEGVHLIKSGEVLSISLPKGLRLLSISRQPLAGASASAADAENGATSAVAPFAGSISVCFERR